MSSPSDDNAFDEYLGRKTPVSQQYRGLPDDEVPAHLDASILAQARAAVGGQAVDELAQVREKRRRLLRWAVPGALAASTLLVVSIVIRSGTQHEVTSADFPSAVSQSAPVSPAAPPARPASAEPAADESVVMIAPPRDAVTEFSSYAKKAAPAPVPAPQRATPEVQASNEAAGAVPPFEMASPAAAPPPPAVVAQERAEADAAQQEVQQQAFATREQAQAKESRTIAASRAESQSLRRANAELEEIMISRDALQVARLHANPDDWLEHIRQLRREGEQVAADREWKQFQEAYPDHPVAEADLARGRR